MGHIVFATPGIDSFHLHDRLQRELVRRGHRVDILHLDPVEHAFYGCQGVSSTLLAPAPTDPMRAPLDELAAAECRRRCIEPHAHGFRRERDRISNWLARILPSALRWFQHVRPELLLLHARRDAGHALLHFVARECGTRIVWTGEGLLPHTLQWDERGLDGDASSCSRSALDYRLAQSDTSLLHASLTNLLGQTRPSALSRRELQVPPLATRLRLAWHGLVRHGTQQACHALRGWRLALANHGAPPTPPDLPEAPFLAALLQATGDLRVRLDASAPPSHHALVAATVEAGARLDPSMNTVVVLPPAGLHHNELQRLGRMPRVHFAPAQLAAVVAATAVCVTTINHPFATAALLAGTPVLHTGRSLFGLRGVTHQVPTEALANTVAAAATGDSPTLRERFLSTLLRQCHLWCSATEPDHNGLVGFVQAIETRLAERRPRGTELLYRHGPAWPLHAERGNG